VPGAPRRILLAVLVHAAGCCSDGDRGLAPPPGPRLARSCVEAPADAARVTIAGREFCDLAEFAVEPVRGDYYDDDDGFEFDAAGFAEEVDAALAASRPRGWAWTLIQAHRPPGSRVVAAGSGGVAVTGRDAGADVPFTTATPSNIGSVTKLIAAIGVVSVHERVVAELPPERRYSLRRLLAVPVFDLLPTRWQHRYAADNGLREVTIGQLLLHTSRLVSDERDPDVDDNLEGLARNAADPDLGDNSVGYSNINYRLLFLVAGALLDPEGLRAIEERLAGACDDEFDDAYLRAAAVLTRDHLESVLFAGVPGGMPATDCDPATFGTGWSREVAWAYRDGDDAAGATYNSFTTNPGYCSTTGGYYSSADDLGALMHAYHGGLIAPEHRAILEGGSGMGWYVRGQAEVSFAGPDLDATGVVSVLRKHGTQPIRGADDVYHASVYKLPYGHYLALTVNSGYGDGSTTAARTYEFVDAFEAAFSRE
jgi:CubicO group peptidase (beta-lactamase class C family)